MTVDKPDMKPATAIGKISYLEAIHSTDPAIRDLVSNPTWLAAKLAESNMKSDSQVR